jgi:hypothetical protein
MIYSLAKKAPIPNETDIYVYAEKNKFDRKWWTNLGSCNIKKPVNYCRLREKISPCNIAYAYELLTDNIFEVPRLRTIFINHEGYKELLAAGFCE